MQVGYLMTSSEALHDKVRVNGSEPLIRSVDAMVKGLHQFQLRMQSAITNGESGQHTLRIRVRDGAVVGKVVHAVENEL